MGRRVNTSEFRIYKTVGEITKAGKYPVEVVDIIQERNSYEIFYAPHDPKNPEITYAIIRGWIPMEDTGDNVTSRFMKAFNNPTSFKEIIGKTVMAKVGFNTDSEGRQHANVVDFV